MHTPARSPFRAMSPRTWRRVARRLALLLVTLLLAGYFVVDTIVVMRLTKPTRRTLGADPSSYSVAFSDVTFHPRGEASITLSGWFMPSSASVRAVVVVHGFGLGGCRTCGFNGHLGEMAAGLQKRGFSVLSFDLRGHGRSSDARYTFGLGEKQDVEGAIDWLLARGFRPGAIGIVGESMGGAASIFATAEEPAIGALVTDSTFADLNQVLQLQFPRYSGLPAFFLPGAYLAGRLITGYDLSTARPVEWMGSIAPRPVLLIHGTADSFVPSQSAQQLAQAAPWAEVWMVSGVNHVATYQNDPQAYLDRIAGFFLENLEPSQQ